MSRLNESGKESRGSIFNDILKHDPQTGPELEDVIYNLAGKISDESGQPVDIQRIYETYKKIYNKTLKHARNFYVAYENKYPIASMSWNDILAKSKKYKNKYNLTENEYSLFLKLVKDRRTEKITDNGLSFINYDMSKTLGFERRMYKLNVPDNEKEVVNEIIKLDNENKNLSKNIKIQSLLYTNEVALTKGLSGTFDPHYHKVENAINPVIAAMFLIKSKYFDDRVLNADIANMIHRLAKHEILNDQPTKDLYDDIIRDPNHNSEHHKITPIKDLALRAQIQACMWDVVFNLRNGNYYSSQLIGKLNEYVDKYPINDFDAVDVNIAVDSGAWLRKFMNAFSMRPTIVARSKVKNPIYQQFKALKMMDDYDKYGNYIDMTDYVESSDKIEDIINIPMITTRLPPQNDNNNLEIKISADISQLNWYKNENRPVIYNEKIVSSAGVLIFYVNRTYSTIRYRGSYMDRFKTQSNIQYDMLPPALTGTDNINTTRVGFDPVLFIENNSFTLQSVVCYETVEVQVTETKNASVCVGSSAIINLEGSTGMEHFCYNPNLVNYGVSAKLEPVTRIHEISQTNAADELTYEEFVSNFGSIFIYVNNID